MSLRSMIHKMIPAILFFLASFGTVNGAFELGIGDDSDLFNFVTVRSNDPLSVLRTIGSIDSTGSVQRSKFPVST
jgi:hypothetical protein